MAAGSCWPGKATSSPNGRIRAADRKRETADLLRPVLMAEDGRWIADYVRLSFRARLPG